MFIELMPLIERRTITITVGALKQGLIRVNVVPTALAEDSKLNEKISYSNKEKIAQIPESAIHALTTPLSLTGTPDEIDAQLAAQLKAFVESHLALKQSIDRAKQEIADAVMAIEERDKNRSRTRTGSVTKADEKSSVDGSEGPRAPADSLPLFEPKAAPQQ